MRNTILDHLDAIQKELGNISVEHPTAFPLWSDNGAILGFKHTLQKPVRLRLQQQASLSQAEKHNRKLKDISKWHERDLEVCDLVVTSDAESQCRRLARPIRYDGAVEIAVFVL